MSLTLLNLVKEEVGELESQASSNACMSDSKKQGDIDRSGKLFGQSCQHCRFVFYANYKSDFCSGDCRWSAGFLIRAKDQRSLSEHIRGIKIRS